MSKFQKTAGSIQAARENTQLLEPWNFFKFSIFVRQFCFFVSETLPLSILHSVRSKLFSSCSYCRTRIDPYMQCGGSGMFIPDPGSDFFPSWIPDPNCLHPGSRILIKEFKYFNPEKSKKMVSKL